MSNTINLFMFAYQRSFGGSLKYAVEALLQDLGLKVEVSTLLVGVRRPEARSPHPVCVEPESAEHTLDGLKDVPDAVEAAYSAHPAHGLFYENDPLSMQEKPENIRRACVRDCVGEALAALDPAASHVSFAGAAGSVGDYHVVPVIRIPAYVFELYPPLPVIETQAGYRSSQGLLHECLHEVLKEATEELRRPHPGRSISLTSRSSRDLARTGVVHFMRSVSLCLRNRDMPFSELLDPINQLSALLYEGRTGRGRLLLTAPDNVSVSYSVRLASPVAFGEARWARKVLQMSSPEFALIADGQAIYGLGELDEGHDPRAQDVFWIDFIDRYHWNLRLGGRTLMRTEFGEPRLPQEPVAKPRVCDTFRRLFDSAGEGDAERVWHLLATMAEDHNGSMVVVCADAAAEAKRLRHQGMVIEPTLLTPELLRRAGKVDGSILIDPSGVCHALGVILDGQASERCTPSRGSRYNSAVRYVFSAPASRMALVKSEDGTMDILPLLRPRMLRSMVETSVRQLELAGPDDFHAARKWLDENRFYLSQAQCERANAALDRIEAMPRPDFSIMISTERFSLHAEMGDSYYADEAASPTSPERAPEAPADATAAGRGLHDR